MALHSPTHISDIIQHQPFDGLKEPIPKPNIEPTFIYKDSWVAPQDKREEIIGVWIIRVEPNRQEIYDNVLKSQYTIREETKNILQWALKDPFIAKPLEYLGSKIPCYEKKWIVWWCPRAAVSKAIGQVEKFKFNDIDMVTSFSGNLRAKLKIGKIKTSTLWSIKWFPYWSGLSFDIWDILGREEHRLRRHSAEYYFIDNTYSSGGNIPFNPPINAYSNQITIGMYKQRKIQTPSIYTVLSCFSLNIDKIAYDIDTQELIDLGAIDGIVNKTILSPKDSIFPDRRNAFRTTLYAHRLWYDLDSCRLYFDDMDKKEHWKQIIDYLKYRQCTEEEIDHVERSLDELIYENFQRGMKMCC